MAKSIAERKRSEMEVANLASPPRQEAERTSSQRAKLLGSYSDWAAYKVVGSSKQHCFVVSEPKGSAPRNVKRDSVFFNVSFLPSEKVTNEINIMMGYPLKPGVDVKVKVGGEEFNLFTKANGAFLESPVTETKLVALMKRGAEMVVQGLSTHGVTTRDTYSLNGISAALNRVSKECN